MSKEIDELNEIIEREKDIDRRRKEVSEKDLILKEYRVDRDLEELQKNKTELEQAKHVKFGEMTEEDVQQLILDNDAYMEAAKNAMEFINSEFKGIVPFFKRNLILIGGDTGDGKSTAVSGIIYSVITRKDKITNKNGRCLVLTNEEDVSDVINRVTCLLKGWKYTNHDQFTEEQKATFKEYIPILTKDGRLTVIGDVYQGVPGWTTTPEGIEAIFNNLIRDGEFYSTVIIDYYQNVKTSKINPKLAEWECQQKLCGILDGMKIRYPAPIVILAQMAKLTSEDDTTPFNVRLKGRKILCDKCTFICELIPERQLLRSKWKVHKSRFTEAVGNSIYTGYDKGKYVPYSVEFQKNVAKVIERNLERQKEQELGIMKEEDIEKTN